MTEQKYIWGHSKRYNDFSTFFKNHFAERVQKVSIDAGFTCPNRDGTKGLGGCTYCDNKTFKPTYTNLKNSVSQQVEQGIAFFSKKSFPVEKNLVKTILKFAPNRCFFKAIVNKNQSSR